MEFVKKNGMYEAEFEATADFNLHIERVAGGRFLIYQKSVSDGKYDIVDGVGYKDHKDVIDLDMAAIVYPKFIKVVSESEVTRAEITEATSGEKPVAKEFTFAIDGYEGYTALEGMTWKEWIDSDYCPHTEDEAFTDNGSGFVYASWVAGDGFPIAAYGYVYDNNSQIGINDVISPIANYNRQQM